MDSNGTANGWLYVDDGDTYNYARKDDYKLISVEYKNGNLHGKVINGTFSTDSDKVCCIEIIGIEHQIGKGEAILRTLNDDEEWVDVAKINTEVIEEDNTRTMVIMDPKIHLWN